MIRLTLIDEISEPLRRAHEAVSALPELPQRARQIVQGVGGLSHVVAFQLDRDPAAGADQFVARLQLTQRGADLVRALGASNVDG